ncbi:MAG TPA: BspA family leucine-rich repeat surface protein, partial [Lutibacter sp.]|nr:BspA family leucine-rich repeat surface protein [Lutibacter sp.]
KEKIITINHWGDQTWSSMENAFFGCSNLELNTNDNPDLSNTINSNGMFRGCSILNEDLNAWDTSNIQNMSNMFENCTSFDQNIDGWNISSLTDATDMFKNVTLSTANYDALLIGWEGNLHNNNVPFSGGNSKYCSAEDARTRLINDDTWSIIDGGLGCAVLSLDDFVITIKTDNTGSSSDTEFTIPTYSGATYNYDVDWNNDGIFDQFGLTGNVTHNFNTSGIYTIRIRGVFPIIYFYGGGDRRKILSVDQWGNQIWTSMAGAFAGCKNLHVNASDAPDLSVVSDMSFMFTGADVMNENINHWDVSNVQNMGALFSSADRFNQPLNNWNVSNVTHMQSMFSATAFNQNINNWDVSNVQNMYTMFSDARSFNQPLNNWVTSNVIDMSGMFQSAYKFNQPIDDWDTSNVVDMSFLFSVAKEFNQPLNNWDVSNVTRMNYMFQVNRVFNQPLDNWDVGNVQRFDSMFLSSISFDQNIGDWNISNLTNATYMFKNVTLSTANYDALLIGWEDNLHNNNVPFSGGNSKYCSAEDARTRLINDDAWSIIDGGLECPTVPTFSQVPPICSGETLNPLPNTSINNITGTWSPAIDNLITTTYTFTPDSNQNASTVQMTITVNPLPNSGIIWSNYTCESNLILTSNTYTETSDYLTNIQQELGTNYVVADWNDLIAIIDVDAFVSCMNIQENDTFLITKDGTKVQSGTRNYFVRYSTDGVPNYFLIFDQFSDFYLGSWRNLNAKILAKMTCLKLCEGDSATFSSSGDSGGIWSSSDNSIATIDANGNLTTITDGNVTISYTVTNEACTDVSSMDVVINQKVTPTFDAVTAICDGDTLTALPTTSTNGI